MPRSDWFCPRAFTGFLLSAAASGLLAGCVSIPSSARRGLPASLQAERTCRRIMADLPAGITVKEARKAYGHCLRVMNEDDPLGADSSVAFPGRGPEVVTPPVAMVPPVPAPVQERYVYCRTHSEAIKAAADRYNRSLMAFGSSQGEPRSEAYARAQQELAEALQALAEAIPEKFRVGRNLLPDALREFQSCRFSP